MENNTYRNSDKYTDEASGNGKGHKNTDFEGETEKQQQIPTLGSQGKDGKLSFALRKLAEKPRLRLRDSDEITRHLHRQTFLCWISRETRQWLPRERGSEQNQRAPSDGREMRILVVWYPEKKEWRKQ